MNSPWNDDPPGCGDVYCDEVQPMRRVNARLKSEAELRIITATRRARKGGGADQLEREDFDQERLDALLTEQAAIRARVACMSPDLRRFYEDCMAL